jgi:two-component system, NarL family, sensor histidine kinase EvgS
MDGIEATQEIRTILNNDKRHVPILGLTANANETTHQECIQVGMNDIVFKPFDKTDLINKMNLLLAQRS